MAPYLKTLKTIIPLVGPVAEAVKPLFVRAGKNDTVPPPPKQEDVTDALTEQSPDELEAISSRIEGLSSAITSQQALIERLQDTVVQTAAEQEALAAALSGALRQLQITKILTMLCLAVSAAALWAATR